MSRGRLGRYSAWQFRDFVVDKGIAVLIIGLLLGYLAIEPMRRALGPTWATNPAFPIAKILANIASPVVTLAVLIALNGMVSSDRKAGYYRFLFSKPVRPAIYYAQLFAVHMVGVLLSMVILTALFGFLVAPVPVAQILLYTLVVYVAMGGIGFFVSAATRYDWVILSTIWLGSRILRAIYQGKPGIRGALVQLLPPVHRLDDVANRLLTGQMAATNDVLWLVGYGILFFALGLVVITRRSLVD